MSLPLSAATAPRRPAPRTERRLRAVERPATVRRPRLLYGIVAVAGAAAIAAAQMGLSIATTQGSYALAELTDRQQALDWQTQLLHEQLAGLDSPQYLAANAAALGMVVENAPAYLRLSDGAVTGVAAPASGASNVNPLSSASVPNALVAHVPLVTDPSGTIASGQALAQTLPPIDPQAPPPVADALPTPATH